MQGSPRNCRKQLGGKGGGKVFFLNIFTVSQTLQFREADLLLTMAKWFFISLNSGFRQMKVHKNNVDMKTFNNYFEWYGGGGALL